MALVLREMAQGKEIVLWLSAGVASFFGLTYKHAARRGRGLAGQTLILPTWTRFPGTWAAFPSRRDPKLTRDGLGFKRNGPGKGNRTLAFGRCGQFFWTYLRTCFKKGPRVGWANFDFGPPGIDFLEPG